MKKLFNMKAYLYACLITICIGWVSCDNVNDWDVDESYKGLFRPLTFDKVENTSTTVLLRYTQIVGAKKYLFEFYNDSTEFQSANYFRTDTILADTLTVFSDSDTPMNVQYRTLFKEFNGSTQYCVRMKGMNADGVVSQYVELAFKTSAEQIFEDIETSMNSVTLYWLDTPRVTHLLLAKLINPTKGEYGEPETVELTAEDIANHSKVLSDLPSGTGYKVQICNGNTIRGEYVFKTLGLGDGVVIKIPESADENDVVDVASLFVGITASNLTLEFEAGKLYNLGKNIKIPAVDNVLFTSTSTDEENRPRIILEGITLTSQIESMSFEYISIDALGNNNTFIEIKNTFSSITFEGCAVRNVGRSVVRLNGTGFRVSDITFNNTMLSLIGTNGYGLITADKNSTTDMVLNKVAITNCTLIDMGERLMELYGKEISLVLLKNCTLYSGTGLSKQLGHLFRLNGNPMPVSAVEIQNNIFAGPNANTSGNSGTINPGYQDYAILDFSENNYMTSDMKVGNMKFKGITRLEQTSDDLFVDPTNGDFHIKPGAGFAGTGNAGDSRWWK